MQLQNERSFLANLRMLSDWSVDCNKICDGTVYLIIAVICHHIRHVESEVNMLLALLFYFDRKAC